MTIESRQYTRVVVPLLSGALLVACSDDGGPSDPSVGTSGASGSSATGGSSNGGQAAAGASTGGAPTAGNASTAGSAGASGAASGGRSGGVGGGGSSSGGSAGAAVGGTTGGGGVGGTGAGGFAGAGAGGAPPSTGSVENSGADCAVMAGELKKNQKLPDPFAMNDGTRITTKSAWRCRRNEIKKDIEKYEIGPKPAPPKVEATLDGSKLNVKVTTDAGSITLSSTVGSANGSSCVAIGMNGNASLVSGCVQIPFMHDQVVKYGSDDSQLQSDPFYKVYPDLYGKIGNYAAWSWGISRIIDGIVQLKDQLEVDPTKIAVQGCSYAGKMALFGGAFDERVALTVAQESGGGGINSWRTSQDFTTRTGTNIEKINNTSGSWFMKSMKQLDPYSLPHDHHELIAMIAPRAVIALGNQDFEWLGDESGWKSINVAKEVWKALGAEDRIGFDFTSNHGHCQAPASQTASVKAFVDKFLKGQTASTAIAIKPQEGNFQLEITGNIDWTTPALP